MLKHVLLAGAVMISVPVTAQTAPTGDQTKPATPATSAAVPKTATPSTPTTPQPTAPAAPVTTTDATVPVANAQPSAPVAAEPAAAPNPGAQIADVVGKEFPSYDKNGDGKLNKAEFGSWMFALRKASDASLKDDAANKTYVAGAFATADTDKSKSVSKDELTNYLTQGQMAAAAPAPGAAQPAPAPETPAAAAPAPTAPVPAAPSAPAKPAPTAPQPDK